MSKTDSKRKKGRVRSSGPFSAYRPVIDAAVLVLSLLGILVVVHLWIQSSRGFDRGCFGFTEPEMVDTSFDCEAVTRSEAGKLFGVSNVIWGGLFYLFLVGAGLALSRAKQVRIPRIKRVRALALTFGLAYSAYLSYSQFYDIGTLCKLCLMSAGIVAVLFTLQVVDYVTKPDASKQSQEQDLGRRRWMLSVGLVVATILVAGADLGYFSTLPDPVEANPTALAEDPTDGGDENGVCGYDPEKPLVENYRDLVTFNDPYLGDPEADVVVIEFFDPNCPHCKTMHPVMSAVAEANKEEAWFVVRPFVLWQQSLAQSEALLAAAHEGKFFEMLDRQFELQSREGLSIDQLRAIATEIGMDADLMASRIQQGLFRNKLLRQKQSGVEAGVTSVPAVMINGRFVDRTSRTEDCLTQLIAEAG